MKWNYLNNNKNFLITKDGNFLYTSPGSMSFLSKEIARILSYNDAVLFFKNWGDIYPKAKLIFK